LVAALNGAMPPKKAGGAKKADADDPGFQAMKAFKRAYESANLLHETEALSLNLDPGEDYTCIARLVLTPLVTGVHTACPLTPVHVRSICDALATYPFMRRLCFWGVGVRDEGAAALSAYVLANRTLRVLELTDCQIGPAACKALGEALAVHGAPKDLSVLKLDHNRAIGNAGIAALMDAGPSICVRDLSLAFCGLEGTEGGGVIAERLLAKPMLTHLRLKGNRLETDGVIRVLDAARNATSLFHLDLADTATGIEPDLLKLLTEVLATCTWLHEYSIAGLPMGDSVAYLLLRAVKQLPHVIEFEVSDLIDPLLYKQLGDAMTANRKDWVKRNKKKKGKGKGKKKK